MITADSLRLYLVLDPALCVSLSVQATVEAAIAGGITCLQMRWKTGIDREIIEVGRSIHPALQASNIPLIINDRIDLALAIGAEGVHLGVDDLPVDIARSLAGPEFIIGYSPETDEQLDEAEVSVSYFGIGPLFHTGTKTDAGSALGPTEFARKRQRTTLPVVAIGGITATNAQVALDAGADGVAVVSAILAANDVRQATADLLAAVQQVGT